jgi:hypothetical protein
MSGCAVTGAGLSGAGSPWLPREPESDGLASGHPPGPPTWPSRVARWAASMPLRAAVSPHQPPKPVRILSNHIFLPGAPLRNRTVDLLLTMDSRVSLPSAMVAAAAEVVEYGTPPTGLGAAGRRQASCWRLRELLAPHLARMPMSVRCTRAAFAGRRVASFRFRRARPGLGPDRPVPPPSCLPWQLA